MELEKYWSIAQPKKTLVAGKFFDQYLTPKTRTFPPLSFLQVIVLPDTLTEKYVPLATWIGVLTIPDDRCTSKYIDPSVAAIKTAFPTSKVIVTGVGS